ncbi:hypothetical protein RFI_11617 [Reticulomyxa filosa]|uniref:RRM domain-containing protein n=1 Tax=Reticulomyxa filosa TaxID=46433 RepID=X6NII0_RETFI|nr:hypothetical protein RFI_11617 [Reticulomyxa filosa]|eukprot:ETO25524.1 hypothetical protein RFI_11617 [Reticulomyxa filosa]
MSSEKIHANSVSPSPQENHSQEGSENGLDETDPDLLEKSGNEVPTEKETNEQSNRSKTMEEWLQQDSLIVHPVWIGNLPAQTTVKSLREFVETKIGKVVVSLHVSDNGSNSGERKYAFLNLPFAEKQILAATLLDGQIFNGEKLIVRPKRRSKFPQSFFGSSPINAHFKKFRDNVAQQIFSNPGLLNLQNVRKCLEENGISIEHLPNRMWCVHCTLAPHCHRSYCSFYHKSQEKELGRILSLLAAEHYDHKNATFANESNILASDASELRSRHTLIIQGLPKNITSIKIHKWFEVFGDIDRVVPHATHTYLRMKRSQDARKIVHLLKGNNAKIVINFAPYYQAEEQMMQSFDQQIQAENDAITDPFYKKPKRNNAKRKHPKLQDQWNPHIENVNGENTTAITTASSNTNSSINQSNLNSMLALSTNTKTVPFSVPFQSISSIATTVPPVSSISIPLQLIPAQVLPVLSTSATTYMYSDYAPSTQTSGMYGTPTYMFTHATTPSYCHTPTDGINYMSTPNLINGLPSPLPSYYDSIHPLAALPMATPLLSGITVNSNSGYPAPISNRRSEQPIPKPFTEQKNAFPKISPFTTDSLVNSMEHLFLAGNNTPVCNETSP